MHLIAAIPGGWSPNQEGVVHVDQSPGDIVFLSASDTEIATFSEAFQSLHHEHAGIPTLRLANMGYFKQELTVDTYVEEVLSHAKLIVLRVLGGKGYFSYLTEQVQVLGRTQGIPVIFLPGHDSMDEELVHASSIDSAFFRVLWKYFLTVNVSNGRGALQLLLNRFFGFNLAVAEPFIAPDIFPYHPQHGIVDVTSPVVRSAQVVIIAYRAHYLSHNLDPIICLIEMLARQGAPAVVIFVQGLREAYLVNELSGILEEMRRHSLGVIVKTTGFSIRQFDRDDASEFIYSRIGVPVIQAIHASSTLEAWQAGSFGLLPTDIAMNVALPELDGRIITRAISFKHSQGKDAITDSSIVRYAAYEPGCDFVARFAGRWLALQGKRNADKKIALILPNYPNKDSRLANGVGLDTPASTIAILEALRDDGYCVGASMPAEADALMQQLASRMTNDLNRLEGSAYDASLPEMLFLEYYGKLSDAIRKRVEAQWGDYRDDPYFDGDSFAIPGIYSENVFISIQPSRGYHVDVHKTYHSPDLPPPFSYFAFYFWVQHVLAADAVVHLGKHGNLEWLPGKSLAPDDASCFPAAIFDAIPHFYPFIINDPGEGSQAKRRSHAVIIDHLIPPMTRAETYGVLMQLENLIDEYYEAFHSDARRTRVLRKEIEKLVAEHHLKKDLAIDSDDVDELLVKLDSYLCEVKEAQIRDGLHIFGHAPIGGQLVDLLVALHRLPNGVQPGLTQALARDLGFPLDPLQTDYALPFGKVVQGVLCRSHGDVVETLEHMAKQLVEALLLHAVMPEQALPYPETAGVLHCILADTLPKVVATHEETDHLLLGLRGRYIPAGGSGAPTRGRVDILPTGKNFYSIDVRTVPTEAAYQVGRKSAEALVQRYVQEHGDYPESIGLSVWGTATMRTGGDDIAQAMALMGVKPVWQHANRRVSDFEIIPVFKLGRPRIDVTLRVSGFFRDAFPDIIALFNAVVEKVIALDEADEDNYIRKRYLRERAAWQKQGYTDEQAEQMSQYRVFGSKPGAYGAGLQALIDEQAWDTKDDLAAAYITWSSYAYDRQARGVSATAAFRERLRHMQVVMQNQDNREHDILDSDDYYQFQGGLANAAGSVRGEQPDIYFGDHSRPDNPRIKTLQQELLKVFRSRVVNPKWIEGIKRHGYKGAFEIAATLDYMFAYDATTSLVEDFMYEGFAQAYLFDADTVSFIEKSNPWALRDMSERLLEAIQRGMWAKPDEATVERLKNIYVQGEL